MASLTRQRGSGWPQRWGGGSGGVMADPALEQSGSAPAPGLGASPQPHPAAAPPSPTQEQTGIACSHTKPAEAARRGPRAAPPPAPAIIVFSLISLWSKQGPSLTLGHPLGPAFPLATKAVFLSRELFLPTRCGSQHPWSPPGPALQPPRSGAPRNPGANPPKRLYFNHHKALFLISSPAAAQVPPVAALGGASAGAGAGNRCQNWTPSKTLMPGGMLRRKAFVPRGRGASGGIFCCCCKERRDGKRGHGSRG